MPDISIVVGIIAVGLMMVYQSSWRILHLVDRDDGEPRPWVLWRMCSGLGCVLWGLIGFLVLENMRHHEVVVKFTTANGLNPSISLVLLGVGAAAVAVLNSCLDYGCWGRILDNFTKALTPRTSP